MIIGCICRWCVRYPRLTHRRESFECIKIDMCVPSSLVSRYAIRTVELCCIHTMALRCEKFVRWFDTSSVGRPADVCMSATCRNMDRRCLLCHSYFAFCVVASSFVRTSRRRCARLFDVFCMHVCARGIYVYTQRGLSGTRSSSSLLDFVLDVSWCVFTVFGYSCVDLRV